MLATRPALSMGPKRRSNVSAIRLMHCFVGVLATVAVLLCGAAHGQLGDVLSAQTMALLAAPVFTTNASRMWFDSQGCHLDGAKCPDQLTWGLMCGPCNDNQYFYAIGNIINMTSPDAVFALAPDTFLMPYPYRRDNSFSDNLQTWKPQILASGTVMVTVPRGRIVMPKRTGVYATNSGYGGGGGGQGEYFSYNATVCDDKQISVSGGTTGAFSDGTDGYAGYAPNSGQDLSWANMNVQTTNKYHEPCVGYGGTGGGVGGFDGGGANASVSSTRAYVAAGLEGGRGGGSFGGRGGVPSGRNEKCNASFVNLPEAAGGSGQPGGYLGVGVNGESQQQADASDDVYLGGGGGGGAGGRSSGRFCCGGGAGGAGGSLAVRASKGCAAGAGGNGGAVGGGAVVLSAQDIEFDGDIRAHGAGAYIDGKPRAGYGAGGGVLLKATGSLTVGANAKIASQGAVAVMEGTSTSTENGGSVKLRAGTLVSAVNVANAVIAGRLSIVYQSIQDPSKPLGETLTATQLASYTKIVQISGSKVYFNTSGCFADGAPCPNTLQYTATCSGCGPSSKLYYFNILNPINLTTPGVEFTVGTNVVLRPYTYAPQGKNFAVKTWAPFGVSGSGVLMITAVDGTVVVSEGAGLVSSYSGYGGGGGGAGETFLANATICTRSQIISVGGITEAFSGGLDGILGFTAGSGTMLDSDRAFIRDSNGLHEPCVGYGGDGGARGGFYGGGSSVDTPFTSISTTFPFEGGRGGGPFGGAGGAYSSANKRCEYYDEQTPEQSGQPGSPGGYLGFGTNGENGVDSSDNVYLGSGGGGGSGGRASGVGGRIGCCGSGAGGYGGYGGAVGGRNCASGAGGGGGAVGGGAIVVIARDIVFNGFGEADGAGRSAISAGFGAGSGILLKGTKSLRIGKAARLSSLGGRSVNINDAGTTVNGGTVKLRSPVIIATGNLTTQVTAGARSVVGNVSSSEPQVDVCVAASIPSAKTLYGNNASLGFEYNTNATVLVLSRCAGVLGDKSIVCVAGTCVLTLGGNTWAVLNNDQPSLIVRGIETATNVPYLVDKSGALYSADPSAQYALKQTASASVLSSPTFVHAFTVARDTTYTWQDAFATDCRGLIATKSKAYTVVWSCDA
eukprot:Opistho-2@16765